MKNSVLVDFRIELEEEKSLLNLGYNVLICPPSSNLYEAVCGHPDMLIHFLDENTAIVHKDTPKDFVENLQDLNMKILFSKNSLNSTYPYDIHLNAVNTKNLFMHYIKYTDETIFNKITNKKILNVRQGYTKCSTVIVNDHTFITSDINIRKALEKEGFSVLCIPPGDIILPGLNYGFIGGTCGLLNHNTLAFYGDLNYYKYGKEVLDFLEKNNVKPVFLRKGPLVDRGSIFTITNA